MTFARLLIGLVVLLYACSNSEADMVEKSHPNQFFDEGPRRQMAQAIATGDLARVEVLAPLVDLNAEDKDDMTLLFYAMLQRQFPIITRLVELGADPARRNPETGAPLAQAVTADDPRILEALLAGGADPNTKLQGEPILFETVNERQVAHMRLLLDHGADINAKDSLGQTALINSLDSYQFDQSIELIERGADVHIIDKTGVSTAYTVEFLLTRQEPSMPGWERLQTIKAMMEERSVTFPADPPDVVRKKLGIPEPQLPPFR